MPVKDSQKADQYHSYRKGWLDGARCALMDVKFSERPDRPDMQEEYKRGYADSTIARNKDLQKAQDRIGHRPSILR